MAGNQQQQHRSEADDLRARSAPGTDGRSADRELTSDGAVDRVVTDVKDGVELVAEKIKDLLRSTR